jgi:PhnB protein
LTVTSPSPPNACRDFWALAHQAIDQREGQDEFATAMSVRREKVAVRTFLSIPEQRKEYIMELNPYLSFDGQCEAAFKFYERCLGGRIVAMMTYADSPMEEQTPSEWRNKIMHARLIVGDRILMGSDAPSDRYEPMKGFSVTLGIDDPKDAERIFHALSENGTVQMPIQKTFWAARFGMLVDQFGTPWMVNCEQPV